MRKQRLGLRARPRSRPHRAPRHRDRCNDLRAVAPIHFVAVVLGRIVARRDHHACRGATRDNGKSGGEGLARHRQSSQTTKPRERRRSGRRLRAKVRTLRAAVVADDDAPLFSAGHFLFEHVAQRVGRGDDDGRVHARFAGTDDAAQPGGAEFEWARSGRAAQLSSLKSAVNSVTVSESGSLAIHALARVRSKCHFRFLAGARIFVVQKANHKKRFILFLLAPSPFGDFQGSSVVGSRSLGHSEGVRQLVGARPAVGRMRKRRNFTAGVARRREELTGVARQARRRLLRACRWRGWFRRASRLRGRGRSSSRRI